MRTNLSRAGAGAAALALWLGATPILAQNLLPNGEFHDDLAGWYNDTNGGQLWTLEDADGCEPWSGNFNAQSFQGSPAVHSFSTRAMEIVAVVPGETLYASVTYKTGADFVILSMVHCADADCSTQQYGGDVTFGGPSQQVPAEYRTIHGATVIPDSGVAAVLLQVRAQRGGIGEFVIDFDNAYLGRVPLVFAEGFEAETTCRWGAVEGEL